MEELAKKYPNKTLVRVKKVEYKFADFQMFMNQFVGLVGVVSGILPDGEIEVTFKDDYGTIQMCFDENEIEVVEDKYNRFFYEMYGAKMGRIGWLFESEVE